MKKWIVSLVLMLVMSVSVSAVEYKLYTQTDSRIDQPVTSFDLLTVETMQNRTPIKGKLYGYNIDGHGCMFQVYDYWYPSVEWKPYFVVTNIERNTRTGHRAPYPTCPGGSNKKVKVVEQVVTQPVEEEQGCEEEFEAFKLCYGQDPVEEQCMIYDYNNDNKIDLSDFARFGQLCLN